MDVTEEWERRAIGVELLTYSQPLDQALVSLETILPEIIQEPPPLPNHLEEASTRMVILHMNLEVPGEMFDALA